MNILLISGFLLILSQSRGDIPKPKPEEKIINCETEWAHFKVKFNKVYESKADEKARKKIFLDNIEFINKHNKLYRNGETSYTMGINAYTDWTANEFSMYYLKHPARSYNNSDFEKINPKNKTLEDLLPKFVDYRTRGWVTRVKNQFDCGDCYAFATVAVMEAYNFNRTGKLIELSQQNLLDCSLEEGNRGCSGGLSIRNYQYIQKNGLNSAATYPYKAKVGSCHYDNSSVIDVHIKGFSCIGSYDEQEMQSFIAEYGPLEIVLNFGPRTTQFYKAGVYYDSSCSSDLSNVDHAMAVVGYGTMGNDDYWICKNSIGTTWGMEGYFLLARNRGLCSVNTLPCFPFYWS